MANEQCKDNLPFFVHFSLLIFHSSFFPAPSPTPDTTPLPSQAQDG
jgi:hypothetical protein